MIHFKDIRFGQASAELESSYYPELLLDGFLDPWDLIEQALNGPKFLYLGYKGSGKSAIGEHLRLKSENGFTLFVNNTFLSDFPYGNFSKIVTGDAEPESRFPSAWSWILILYMIDSFSKDMGSESNMCNDFVSPVKALKSVGLLPTDDIKRTVITSSKPRFKAKLPALLEIEWDANSKKVTDLHFLHIIDHLKKIALQFKSDNQHVLVIDGLDDILFQKEIQYQSIAALILEVTRLNSLFYKNNIRAKIIVLCRTELYERLPCPNKNKIRQDLSIELDWYHNPQKPSSSKLVYLVNKRAQLTDQSLKDIFLQLLPRDIYDKSLLTFLFQYTRHTPRDFIQLLTHIQECCSRKKVEISNVFAGIRNYSSKYFLPEIKDELVGYTNREDAEMILKSMSLINKPRFTFKEISEHFFKNFAANNKPLIPILETLFQCSAIGNVRHINGQTIFSFKYRNRHSHFIPEDDIFIHRGLWKGMNIR